MISDIISDNIDETGRVVGEFFHDPIRSRYMDYEKLETHLPYFVKIKNTKSNIKYTGWIINNNVKGWWADCSNHMPPISYKGYIGITVYYFHNINDAVLFKLKYADDCA